MKNHKSYIHKTCVLTTFLLLSAIMFTGCANYSAASLANLSPEIIKTSSSSNNTVQVATKAYTVADCKKYLDRNVISKGYQPVQISIQNFSERTYFFSPDGISLPCARAEEVANKVHTSTVGRATGYAVGSLILWPLAIPAIVDGVKSHHANEALDNDFVGKVAKEQVIFPHSHLNKLIFVPIESFTDTFSITLIDQKTQKPQILDTTSR